MTQTSVNSAIILQDADGDTKVQVEESSDEDKIRFDTAGSERVIIDNAGKVGVGTSTPSQILNVEATTTPVIEVSTLDDNNPASASAIDLVEKQPTHASDTATFGQAGVYGYRIQLNGSDNTLRIKSGSQTTTNDRITLERDTGNVGIGTTSPTGKLEIAATGTNAAPHIKLVESGDTREFNIYNDGSGNGRLVLADSDDDTPDSEIVLADNGQILFNTANTEVGKFDSSGRFGIGTSSPTRVFEVNSGTANAVARFESTDSRALVEFKDNAGTASIGNIGNSLSFFPDNATETMRIDSSGNVGIGTTSPSYFLHVASPNASDDVCFIHHDNPSQSSGTLLKVKTDAGDSDGYTLLDVATNTGSALFVRGDRKVGIGTSSPSHSLHVVSSGNGEIKAERSSGAAILIQAQSANGKIGTSSNHNLGFNTNGTTRLTIDTSGRLGIGTSSPDDELDVEGADPAIRLTDTSASGYARLFANNGSLLLQSDEGNSVNNSIIGFDVDGTERMRINSSGSVFLGTTTEGTTHAYFSSASDDRMVLHLGNSSTSGTGVAVFQNPNGTVGSIRTSGSSTSFNTSSDYRLKENVDYHFNALDRVAQLKPARFNFIADADTTVDGFLAHEVQDIVPEAISGEKDGVDDEGNPEYQGIDQSKLVPLLTKAIQEQQEQIESLKSEIANLKEK